MAKLAKSGKKMSSHHHAHEGGFKGGQRSNMPEPFHIRMIKKIKHALR